MSIDKNKSDKNDWHLLMKEACDTAILTSKESSKKIEEIAVSVDAVRLLVSVMATLSFGSAEDMNDWTHGNVPAKLELLAYHLFPFFGVSSDRIVTPWHTQICIESLDKMFIARMQKRIFTRVAGRQAASLEEDIALSVRMHTEVVRGSAYPEQTVEEITSVQPRFRTQTQKVNGVKWLPILFLRLHVS